MIRALARDDWQAFRDIRLEALRGDPGLFFTSVDQDIQITDDEWQKRLDLPTQRFFGFFDGTVLSGISGVVTSRDDASGATALFVASYLRPAYRGRGIGTQFHQARLAWAHAQPQFMQILVSHRASNEPSRRAILRSGFVETGRILRRWPDGATDHEVLYRLALRAGE
jgi:RimJ/RimL family protein N-acetyltransferase